MSSESERRLRRRFWSKTRRDGDCVVWQANRHPKGYGQFWFRGTMVRASRVAWILSFGEIPDGLHVLHHCDNRPCVNPQHLFLGTNADNSADRAAKGRTRGGVLFGSANPAARFTAADVARIREQIASGLSLNSIAVRLGVAWTTIHRIAVRKTWRHVA